MITNIVLPGFTNGETVLADELNAILLEIKTVFGSLISDNARSLLLPAGFSGNNAIEITDVTDSLVTIGADNNATITKLTYLTSLINSAVEAMNSASASASAAAVTLASCQAILEQVQALRNEVEYIRNEIVIIGGGGSAYDVAVDNGFSGTQVAWLASLQGSNGTPGADGADGDVTAANLPNTTAYKELETLALVGLK